MLKALAPVLAVLSFALSASSVKASWSFVEPSSMLPTNLASASVVTVGGQKTLIVRELSPTRVWHLVRNGQATRLFGAGDAAPGGGTFRDVDTDFGSIQAERVVFSTSVFVDPANQPGVTATRFYRWDQGTLIHLPKPDDVDYDLSKHDGTGRFLASRIFSSPAGHWITDGITDTAPFTLPAGQFITLVGIFILASAPNPVASGSRSGEQAKKQVPDDACIFSAGLYLE